jgi:putative MATE family efflux protein
MQDFTKGKVLNQIVKFSLPMLAGNMFQQLYNIVDSIIVGRFVGKEALAAVGASFPVIFVIVALIIGIGSGFSVIISQFFGSKQMDKFNSSIDTMTISLGVFSIILTGIGIFGSTHIFKLLGLPENLIPDATLYLNIYLSGTLFVCGFNTIRSTLRGVGDSKTPLKFLIESTITNIVLDIILIVFFDMGIAGAALATMLSHMFIFIHAVLYINKHHSLIRFRFINLKFDKDIFYHAIRIGLPTGIQQTFIAVGMVAVMSIVNKFGTNVIAAYTVGSRIDSLAILPSMSFSQALSSFVGQNIGAKREDRVHKGYRATLLLSLIYCVIITLVIILFGSFIMNIFTTDKEVIEIGEHYLIIISSFYIIASVMFATHGLFKGAGATLVPMFISIIALWGVRVPIAAVLSNIMGEEGIWWSIPMGWTVGVIATLIYYKSGKWKNKGII